MNKYDICVFDLDGTLIDSLADLADSCNEALSVNGMPVHDTDRYKTFVGSGIKNLIKRSMGDKSSDETLSTAVYRTFNILYNEKCLEATKPYDGVSDEQAAAMRAARPEVSFMFKPSRFSSTADGWRETAHNLAVRKAFTNWRAVTAFRSIEDVEYQEGAWLVEVFPSKF